MQKVITINLNGNAYQLDEVGYDALLAYLNDAERKLAGNPDRDEILADLEQAIADKCLGVLGANKSVVSAAEVAQIIKEMGPVEAAAADAGGGSGQSSGAAAAPSGEPRTSASGPRRRLYLIKEGAMVGGVCAGLAAFLGIDVTIVRIVFVVLTVLTKGLGVLAYIVLLIVIPTAATEEERAAARGEPFNAQELIDRAKRQYTDFKGSAKWRRQWNRQRREWRRQQRRAASGAWWPRSGWPQGGPPMAAPGYFTRIGAGFIIPIFTLASAACFWTLVYVVLALVTNREAFGTPLPLEIPLWVGLFGACIAYNVVAWPLHATRRASYHAIAGYNYGMVAAWDGLMSAGFAVLIIWFAYQYVPEVRQLVESLPAFWDNLRMNWNQ